MAVDPKIDELLARLANVKSLPAPSQPFRTAEAAVGSQVRDAAGRAFASTPRLGDAIQGIQQGGSAQTGAGGMLARALGSPLGKVALGGLNLIDAPRRAVISGLKETVDLLDDDPNTKASFKDLRSQFNDPTFGFGRVMPMEGWKGRIVGFIGDVALDPLTYVTLGGTVPVKAIARGAGAAGLRATAKVGAKDVALRAALGTKNITGREGRFALANLVKQYGGNVDEVAAVAARGKSAVPDDIAKVMGLQRNGLYMFGSRVRLPGSGVIGGALESGLIKTRLGITNTNVGKKLQYWYTPKGASGTSGDLKNVRADLASGRLPKDKIDLVFANLRGAENGRARGASYGQQYLRDASQVAKLETVQTFDDQIHRFIETADPSLLSPDQRAATAAVQDHWEKVRILLETEGQRIDPSFRLNVGAIDPTTGRPRYIPHIQTPEMYRWRQRNANSAWAKLLDEQTSVDVLDMNNNLASRFFKKGDQFLGDGPVIQTGTIDELNRLWRDYSKLDFDMFETSTQRILAGYEQTVRGAFEAFTLIDELKNSDFVRLMRTQGEIDPDYLRALERMAKSKTQQVANLNSSARSAADELVKVVQQTFDTNYRRSVASTLQRNIVDVRGEVRAGERAVADAAAASSRAAVLSKQLTDLSAKQQAEAVALAAMFEEKNAVMMFMNDALTRSHDEALDLARQADQMNEMIAARVVSAEEAEAAFEAFTQKAKEVNEALRRSEETLEYYRLYGDELGPALQNIYERIRLADATTAGALDEPEVYRMLESDIQEGLFSGDERVNSVLNILMRPFDNTPYRSSTDLGQAWLSESINSIGDTGRLLNSVPDMGAPKGNRATRANMARAGKSNRRKLTGAQVNDIIGRGATVGDNHEEMADAFFFMTARELRAVYDANGGGAAGLAAQDALAKELLEGTSSRAKVWREARSAVQYVKEQMDVLREIGSMRVQRGGRYADATETIARIGELQNDIDVLQSAVPDLSMQAYNRAKESVDQFTSAPGFVGTPQFSADMFERLNILVNNLAIGRPELQKYAEFIGFQNVIRQTREAIGDGLIPQAKGVKDLFQQIDDFVRREFTNQDELARQIAVKENLEKNAGAALKIDKRYTEVSADLLESSKDAGLKLSNYHILHATRLAVDAIAALTPSGTAPSEALFAFARSGAARQQLKHMTDFQRTVFNAGEVMEKIRTQVFGGVEVAGDVKVAGDRIRSTRVADRAIVLRQAVQNLSDDEREALYAVVGDLSYVEKQISIGTKMEVARRTTPEYAQARDSVWAVEAGNPDWRAQIELDIPSYVRTPSRARTYQYADDAARFETDVSEGVAESVNAQIKEAQNRINRMENATPQALNKEIDRLVSVGKLTSSEADGLRRAVKNGEEAAKRTQKVARERAGATGKGERAARQRARGVLRSGDETFGISRAFWIATRTNADGSTLSNQRVLDFFTMVFGDGEVRVSNSGGFKRPQATREFDVGGGYSQQGRQWSGRSRNEFLESEQGFAVSRESTETLARDAEMFGNPSEEGYRAAVTEIIQKAKAEKQKAKAELPAGLSKDAKEEALRNIERDYWRTLGNEENALVDIRAVERILDDIDKTKVDIRTLKVKAGNEPVGSFKSQSYAASAARLEAKLKSLRGQLNTLEREATQLIQRGTSTPAATYKYISVADSVLGKAGARTRARIEALRTLARDPEAGDAFSLATGVERNEVLTGTFGYVEYLRGRANELQAAYDATQRAAAELNKIEGRIGRSSTARQRGIEEAEQIAANPKMQKRMDAAIDVVSDDETVRSKATRDLLRSKQWTAKEEPLPPRVARIVNEQEQIKRQILAIEKTPEYTTAVEREFRHKALMLLARLDLTDPNIQFPQAVYDESTYGALRAFAKRGAGVREGLDDSSLNVFRMNEVSLEEIGNDVLNGSASKYVFVVGNQRVGESTVRDALLKKNRSTFRYTIDSVDDGSGTKRIVYVDKSNGSRHSFGEKLADETAVGREIVLNDPVYVSKVFTQVQSREGGTLTLADRLTEQYFAVLDGNLISLKKSNRITPGADGDSFFDPLTTYATYGSPAGERVYRLDNIIGPGQRNGTNPLDPQNIFDETQGRGIIGSFDSLFEEPASPTSKRGRELRTQLARKQGERDKVAVRHAKEMDSMRSARTDRARREAQVRAANISEELDVLDSELNLLSVQIGNSSPITQMVTVENFVRVLDYFRENPQLLRQLGVKVDGDVVSDANVLKGIEKYVEALEYQKLNPKKRGTILTGRPRRTGEALRYEGPQGKRRYVGLEVDRPKKVVSTSEVRRRRRVLNKVFDDSPQGKLLADVRNKNARLAANQKELITVRNGGEGAELLAAKRSVEEELARAERNLKLNEKNVSKALRQQKSKVEPLPDETTADTALRVAREEETRLAAKPLQKFGEAVDGPVAAQARADALAAAAPEYATASWYDSAGRNIPQIMDGINADISARRSIVETLKAREVEVRERISVIGKMIAGDKVPAAQRQLLTDELRSLNLQLHGVPRTPKRAGEKGLNQQISEALERINALQKQRRTVEAQLVQERSAADTGFYLELNLNDARKRLDLLSVSLEDIRSIRSRARVGKKDGWMADFDEFANEVSDVMNRLNTMPDGPDTRRLASVLTGYLEARANLLRGTAEAADVAQMERMFASGRMFSEGDHVIFSRVMDEGWEKLTGSGALSTFNNLEMRPEVAEILTNMGRLRDPAFVKQMRVWFGPYTRFFKAWALSTPGYHVRNSLTNAFMLVAAGGRPQFLAEGMREYNALYKAMKNGGNIEKYLNNLPDSRRAIVRDAYQSMLGSGVGQSEEIAFDTAGMLTNNPITRANRKVGAWVEQHSRFMLSYDGIRQGLDVNGATARTRKFLFDYEDISNLDSVMRSIIPFWMWTSRNLPLTIQNIYMNPRPYQWYQSLRRNIEDQEKTEGLPQYMREAGGFALAGTDFAATPDLGFNRLQADVNMLTNPTRFAANVNPLLRVPVETMVAGKSFFRNRDFQQSPIPVEGPVGTLASLLGQPVGAGSSVGGQRFVDEKLLYALGNLVPTLNQVERFIPSQEYYQQRGSTNPLLGYLGAPVREVTPQMTASEQRRILAEIQKLLAAQPKVEQ